MYPKYMEEFKGYKHASLGAGMDFFFRLKLKRGRGVGEGVGGARS